eukprot:763914-Hanusia_phi.AAC.2
MAQDRIWVLGVGLAGGRVVGGLPDLDAMVVGDVDNEVLMGWYVGDEQTWGGTWSSGMYFVIGVVMPTQLKRGRHGLAEGYHACSGLRHYGRCVCDERRKNDDGEAITKHIKGGGMKGDDENYSQEDGSDYEFNCSHGNVRPLPSRNHNYACLPRCRSETPRNLIVT